MEYSTVEQSGNGYVTLSAKGTKLSVARSPKAAECASEFSHTFSHNMTCCSNAHTSSEYRQCDHLPLIYAIGMEDGSVMLLDITSSGCIITPLPAKHKLSTGVNILTCGQGFVFAASTSGECALFYTNLYTQNGAEELQCMRIDVSFLTHNPPPPHSTSFTHSSASKPQRSIPSYATVLPPVDGTAQTDPPQRSALQRLLTSYLNDPAAGAVLCPSSGVPDSEVLLVGCSDGTVWWLQTPNRSTAWELGSDLMAGLAQEGTLLDVFARPVQRILLGSMFTTGDTRDLAPCIVVVEQGGSTTLLSTLGAGRRCREVRQLPATADLASLVCHKGVFVYVDHNTGRLCAASLGTLAVVGDSTLANKELTITALTPLTSPRIQSFRMAPQTENGAGCGHIFLCASDAVHCLPLSSVNGAGDTAAVVALLLKACGNCDQRHPRNLVPVTVKVIADPYIGTATNATPAVTISVGVASTSAAQEQELSRVAAQLISTGVRNEGVLRRCVLADLELLRLAALLQELPAALTAIAKCAGGHDRTVLVNSTGSVEVTYRLRSEPVPTQVIGHDNSDTSNNTCVYLDLSIRTHTLQAMRALQDRDLCVRLQSTLPSSSLHPAVLSSGVRVQLSSVPTGCDSSDNRDRIDCEYITTLPVSGCVQRLSSYRLTMSVAVEAPRDLPRAATRADCSSIDAGAEPNSVLLTVVDHVIPVVDMLPHVLSAGAHDTLHALQQLTSGKSGSRTDTHMEREYTLDIATSAGNSVASGEAVCRGYESAVEGCARQVDQRQRSAAYHRSGGNPLQAAFLVGLGGGSGLFDVGSSTTSTGRDKRIAHKQKMTVRAQRTHPATCTANTDKPTAAAKNIATSSSSSRSSTFDANPSGSTDMACMCTLTGSSRALLATLAADLHDHDLRDSLSVRDRMCEDEFAFKESDALHLATSTQQAMVRAAHLARQNDRDPLSATSSSDETSLKNTETMWELYGAVRSCEI